MRAAQIQQPSIAHEEQDQYAPDEVMNMAPTHHDPLKGPVLMSNKTYQEPYADECDQKGNRRNKHAAARAIGNCGADEKAQAS